MAALGEKRWEAGDAVEESDKSRRTNSRHDKSRFP